MAAEGAGVIASAVMKAGTIVFVLCIMRLINVNRTDMEPINFVLWCCLIMAPSCLWLAVFVKTVLGILVACFSVVVSGRSKIPLFFRMPHGRGRCVVC